MAQKNPMGATMAPPPASPANPTALNFQSDPNMRQQFKGFMSGLSNRPMPQPVAQPMPAPMPMYAPAANVDIFEPIQGFANGGGVTFSSGSDYTPGGGISISSATVQGDDTFGGRNDERDSVGLNDPYEAEMIQTGKSFLDTFGPPSTGGDGPIAFGVGSRPRVDLTARTSPVVDALSSEISKRSNQTGYDDAPMDSRGLLTNQGQADTAMGLGSGFGATGTTKSVAGSPTASGYDEFALGPLNLLGNVNLLDPDAVNRQALDSIARSMQGTYGQVAVNPELTGLAGGAAVVSGRPIQTPDEIAYNDTMMQTDMSPADMRRIGREREAQRLSLGGGQVNVDPVTGEVSSIPVPTSRPSTLIDYTDPTQVSRSVDIASPVSRPGTLIDYDDPTQVPLSGRDLSMASPYDVTPFDRGEAAGEKVAQGEPSGTERERTEAGRTNRVADSGFGLGEVYRTKGDDLTQDEQNKLIENAMNRRTTVTLGLQDPKFGGTAPPLGTPDAVTVSSLEQLARRAGKAPGTVGSQLERDLGLSLANSFSAKNAGKMYDNIVNNQHRPIYDNRGQIIATVNSLGQLGAGSRPINIDFISPRGDDMFNLGGFSYDQLGAMGAQTDGDDNNNALIIRNQIKEIEEEVKDRSEGLGGIGGAPTVSTTSTVQPSTSLTDAAQVANPLQYGYGQIQGINPNLDSAANKFLSILGGFAEGGEVKNFRGGGGVGRQDYQGGTMSGVTGNVSGSTTSDAASSRATEGLNSGTGRSFSGADLYGGDDNNTQTIMATPVQRQSVMATPVQSESVMATRLDGSAPRAEELAPVDSLQSQQQIQQQIAPKNMIQTQVGAIDPASMSMGEKVSLIGEGLGNLLDVDLFSSSEPTVDSEMAARLEAAGFSPSTATSAATPTGGLFDIPSSVPTPASVTSYKQYATTPESRIDMGKVDMGDRGFGFSGLGDALAKAYDVTKQKLSTALDPVDYSNLDQLGQNFRNQ